MSNWGGGDGTVTALKINLRIFDIAKNVIFLRRPQLSVETKTPLIQTERITERINAIFVHIHGYAIIIEEFLRRLRLGQL